MLDRGEKVKLGKKLKIVLEPDQRLHQVSAPVTVVTDETRSIIDDMVTTMLDDGVGLAAVQVGIMQRIFVIDCAGLMDRSENYKKELPPETTILRIINPEIIESCGSETQEEGCLSVPGIHPEISRAESIKIAYLDYWGKPQELELSSWLARCFQHELDHLNGITLLNQLSPLKRSLALKKLQKMQKHSRA